MFDLSLQQILMRLVALLAVSAVHGLFLALAARALGAAGPAQDGRLSLSPAPHVDPWAIVPFLLTQAGWIRPVRLDAGEVRYGRGGLVLAGIAALALTLGFADTAGLARGIAMTTIANPNVSAWTVLWLQTVAQMSVWLVVLNLLPLPPLTGALWLRAVLPDLEARLERQYGTALRVLLLAGLVSGALPWAMRPVVWALLRALGLG